jgi:hypothetical protein
MSRRSTSRSRSARSSGVRRAYARQDRERRSRGARVAAPVMSQPPVSLGCRRRCARSSSRRSAALKCFRWRWSRRPCPRRAVLIAVGPLPRTGRTCSP